MKTSTCTTTENKKIVKEWIMSKPWKAFKSQFRWRCMAGPWHLHANLRNWNPDMGGVTGMPCQMPEVQATVMPCPCPGKGYVSTTCMHASWCLHGDTSARGIQASQQNLTPIFLFSIQVPTQNLPTATDRVRYVGRRGLGMQPETRGINCQRIHMSPKPIFIFPRKQCIFICLSLLDL